MAIKVVALDIYGTVLATEDPENALPPRKGLEDFFDMCDARHIKVVGASDANPDTVKINLRDAEVDIKRFDNFYCLDQLPFKDFSQIILDFAISPAQLIVIGDSDKDRGGADQIGSSYMYVPEYYNSKDHEKFDFSEIKL